MPDQISTLLSEIKQADAFATKGPWRSHQRPERLNSFVDVTEPLEDIALNIGTAEDAYFIALSREAMPALATAVKGVLDVLDGHPAPRQEADPTGYATARLELLEQQVREAIQEALGGDDDQ